MPLDTEVGLGRVEIRSTESRPVRHETLDLLCDSRPAQRTSMANVISIIHWTELCSRARQRRLIFIQGQVYLYVKLVKSSAEENE